MALALFCLTYGFFFALTAPGVGVKAGRHKAGKETDPDDDGRRYPGAQR